eukprot:4786889-Pleurochrysis_carterae.AAC.1
MASSEKVAMDPWHIQASCGQLAALVRIVDSSRMSAHLRDNGRLVDGVDRPLQPLPRGHGISAPLPQLGAHLGLISAVEIGEAQQRRHLGGRSRVGIHVYPLLKRSRFVSAECDEQCELLLHKLVRLRDAGEAERPTPGTYPIVRRTTRDEAVCVEHLPARAPAGLAIVDAHLPRARNRPSPARARACVRR